MAEKRQGKPYVWVTWITKLLGGQQQCTWASWFKARFKYEKLEEGSFDSAAWSARHAELVRRRAAELADDGWAVTLENENGFKLEGTSGVLSGKPDIVARRDAAVRVIDCKTGRQQDADWWQVLIYLFALPIVRKDLITAGAQLEGEVCYQSGPLPVTTEELAERRHDLIRQIKEVTGSGEPRKTPSVSECRYCNIGPADCEARVSEEPEKEGSTDEF